MAEPVNPVFDWAKVHAKRADLAQALVEAWAPVLNEGLCNGKTFVDLDPAPRLSDEIHEMALARLRAFMIASGVQETAEPERFCLPSPTGALRVRLHIDPEPTREPGNVIVLADTCPPKESPKP